VASDFKKALKFIYYWIIWCNVSSTALLSFPFILQFR